MRKMIGIAVALVLVLAVLRRFGPALRDRAMAKCQEMFDRMPEDFPPKRSFHELEEIGAENTSILRRLERQDVGPLLAAAHETRFRSSAAASGDGGEVKWPTTGFPVMWCNMSPPRIVSADRPSERGTGSITRSSSRRC